MPLTLRPWQPGDEEAAVRWAADREFCLANSWTLDLTLQRVRAHWRERKSLSPTLRMIELDGEVIGYAEWQDVQGDVAELGIAIGNSDRWGQGLGLQAGQLMLQLAFGELSLQRVWAEVHATNERSLALMRRLGFTGTGQQGEEEYRGEVVPMVQFELRRENYPGSSG